MKILIFEYITGGGFNRQALPESLSSEGRLMLGALLDNLTRLENIELTVMLDWRLSDLISNNLINTVIISSEQDSSEEFQRLANQADIIWPIAPEFDGILQQLCETAFALGKIVLSSSVKTITIAGNKFKTYELLSQNHITTVPTKIFNPLVTVASDKEWIIKPIDGVGCVDSYIITKPQDLNKIISYKKEYIIQPHLYGAKTSLSCLFKQGRGWLVCANLQNFDIINNQYHLAEIVVNHHPDPGHYQPLIDHIALTLPELWGYAGIDLIETTEQTWVLEINPRLTTSFVGIYDALGINISEAVLQLLDGDPILKPLFNKTISIQTHAS